MSARTTLLCIAATFGVTTGCLLVTHVDDGAFGDGLPATTDASNDDALARDARPDAVPDGAGPCPGTHGPTAVRAGAGCIDSTEVTVDQYRAFLDANVDPATQPSECSGNTTFAPGGFAVQMTGPTFPVARVSWCDARAFCAWSGKHLCGKVDGGGAVSPSAASTNQGEWFAACSHGGDRAFPYGNTYDSSACRGNESGSNVLVLAGSLPGCEGGYPGVHDMSGNAWEWVDACQQTTPGAGGLQDGCVVAGGSVLGNGDELRCISQLLQQRGTKDDSDVSFRCCS